jgi:hypothetical protein
MAAQLSRARRPCYSGFDPGSSVLDQVDVDAPVRTGVLVEIGVHLDSGAPGCHEAHRLSQMGRGGSDCQSLAGRGMAGAAAGLLGDPVGPGLGQLGRAWYPDDSQLDGLAILGRDGDDGVRLLVFRQFDGLNALCRSSTGRRRQHTDYQDALDHDVFPSIERKRPLVCLYNTNVEFVNIK